MEKRHDIKLKGYLLDQLCVRCHQDHLPALIGPVEFVTDRPKKLFAFFKASQTFTIRRIDYDHSGLIDQYVVAGPGNTLPEETVAKLHQAYEFKALLENWEVQWDLRITGEKGCLPKTPRDGNMTSRSTRPLDDCH